MLNARPLDPIQGHERGGQRPGLVEMTDSDGVPWGSLGDGPVQAIVAIPRQARTTGYEVGASAGTHEIWESRETVDLAGNIWILRNKDGTPELSRHAFIGTASDFEDATDRDLTCCVWYAGSKVAGGVNENPFDTDLDSRVFKADVVAGEANNGFGSPIFTYMDDWDTGGAVYSTLGGPWPSERCSIFYGDATLGDCLFVGSTIRKVTVSGTPEPLEKGYLIAYDLDGTAVYTVASGTARERPFGKTYNLHLTGVSPGSISANPGAIEVASCKCVELDDRKFVYFCYTGDVNSESMVGRYDVTNFAANGFSLNKDQSGAIQLNGATFAVGASNYTVPTNPLAPHYLAYNYPRGCRATDVCIDPSGYVYCTRSSTGWGPNQASGGSSVGPTITVDMSHPDYPGAKPVTVVKIDPAGTQFEWEATTHVDPSESFSTRINSPELLCCACDGDAVYVAGREIAGANVFALRSEDGGILWKWRSTSVGGATRINAIAIDKDNGNVWVGGGRTNTWQGVTGSRYANLWLLDRVSGEVLDDHDIGPSTAILSLDINPETGHMLIGTQATST